MVDPVSRVTVIAPCGEIVGTGDRAVVNFRGIRYAHAERFGAPRPLPDQSAPRDATTRGPACPQNGSRLAFLTGPLTDDLVQDEDCLVVSVTAPVNARNLPVMVWLHGGAYLTGGGEARKYDPDLLVAEGSLVVVRVTHRLGVFGYLAPDADAVPNAGLLDQIEALRWVRRNIAAFGGDPGNVTVAGQSAGADSVLCLLVADDVEGLFGRAIMQSAPLGLRWGRHRWEHIDAGTRAAFTSSSAGGDARAATVAELLAAQGHSVASAAGRGPLRSLPFAPAPGMAPLPPALEWDERLTAAADRVELFVGYARRDATAFLAMRSAAARLMRMGRVGRILLSMLAAPATANLFGNAAIRPLVRAWTRAGASLGTFRVDWCPPDAPLGPCHCIELPLLFATDDTPDTWADAPMLGPGNAVVDVQRAQHARRLWADFVRGGLAAVGSTPHRL